MNKIIFLLVVTIPVATCCGQRKESSLFQEARKSIEESNKIYATLANSNDGSILTRYTEDACLFPPNLPPVCGKENISKFFKGGPKVQVKFTIQHLYGDAKEFVIEESYYEMRDLNGAFVDEGKILVVWKKTNEGWKMHRDMFSSNKTK